MLRFVVRLLAIAYGVLLTCGLSISGASPVFRPVPHSGWLAVVAQAGHFITMLVLGIVVTSARPPISRWGLITLLIGYAVAMELLHLLLPTRAFTWTDLAQNIFGVLTGMCIVELISQFHRRQRLSLADDSPLSLFARVHDLDQ